MNTSRQKNIINLVVLIVIVIIIAGLIWGNISFATKNPGGNDFLVHWVATQNFIYNGISPYSDTTALEIQDLVYGRPAREGEHELRPAYPLFSIFLFLPFGLVRNYFIARALWMTFLEISIFVSVIVMLRIAQYKTEKLVLVSILVFSIFWYHGLRSIINGNAVILLLLCFILTIYAIQIKQDELAGIFLGLSMIKPQVGFAFILFILFWGLFNRRFRIIFWFFGSTILLSVLALFLLPDWPIRFLQEVMRYPGYNPPGTPAAALAELLPGIGKQLGIAISFISGIILLIEWLLAKKSANIEFVWVCSITLVLGQWLNVQTDPGNFIVMLPAMFVVFRLVEDRWPRYGSFVNFLILGLLFVVPWLVFALTLSMEYQPIQSPLMFFPVPVILIFVLYWVRWWAKNPVKHVLVNS